MTFTFTLCVIARSDLLSDWLCMGRNAWWSASLIACVKKTRNVQPFRQSDESVGQSDRVMQIYANTSVEIAICIAYSQTAPIPPSSECVTCVVLLSIRGENLWAHQRSAIRFWNDSETHLEATHFFMYRLHYFHAGFSIFFISEFATRSLLMTSYLCDTVRIIKDH